LGDFIRGLGDYAVLLEMFLIRVQGNPFSIWEKNVSPTRKKGLSFRKVLKLKYKLG